MLSTDRRWTRRSIRRRGILVVAALAALILAPTATFAVSGLVGCDTSRSAVAYHADGTIVSAVHTVPCAVRTTYAGAETQIKVAYGGAGTGSIIEEPAFIHPLAPYPPGAPVADALENYAGWAVSSDGGASWTRQIPELREGFGNLDNALYIDRTTGRAFAFSNETVTVPTPLVTTGATLMTSVPPYTLWNRLAPLPYISENPRFTSAPAPAGQPPATAGENPAYWCGNVSIFGAGGRACHRTLDGGTTWTLAANPPAGGDPVGDNSSGPHRGSLWMVASALVPGGDANLARSDDEAATWPIVLNPADGTPVTVPGGGELRVDTAGNLYAFHGRMMRISQDYGVTWTAPLDMTAPDARGRSIGQSAVAVGAPGHVAVAYLVARTDGSGSDGFITVTHDALKADGTPNPDALFYASTVNSPDRQLITAGAAAGGRDDYISVDVGPDGTPWAAFYSDCIQNPDDTYQEPGCAETNGQGSAGVPPTPSPAKASTVGHLEVQLPCAATPDLDGDGIGDACDNCLKLANANQLDSGGINTTVPDGIGNACQCGDVTGNGIVDGQDGNAIKRHGLGLAPNVTFVVPGNCDVTGNDACDGQDSNAVRRIALGLETPAFGQNCHNALGIPVPPGL